MSHHEERFIAEKWRRRSGLRPVEKRQTIEALDDLSARLAHFAPALAALYLNDVWSLRQRLDWGCSPVVR